VVPAIRFTVSPQVALRQKGDLSLSQKRKPDGSKRPQRRDKLRHPHLWMTLRAHYRRQTMRRTIVD
jgi:hypothetical protein